MPVDLQNDADAKKRRDHETSQARRGRERQNPTAHVGSEHRQGIVVFNSSEVPSTQGISMKTEAVLTTDRKKR